MVSGEAAALRARHLFTFNSDLAGLSTWVCEYLARVGAKVYATMSASTRTACGTGSISLVQRSTCSPYRLPATTDSAKSQRFDLAHFRPDRVEDPRIRSFEKHPRRAAQAVGRYPIAPRQASMITPPPLIFPKRRFRSTGTFNYGGHWECEEAVEERGSRCGGIAQCTDYVVIGARLLTLGSTPPSATR